MLLLYQQQKESLFLFLYQGKTTLIPETEAWMAGISHVDSHVTESAARSSLHRRGWPYH